MEVNTDLPSFPLVLPTRDTNVDIYAHRRPILKGDLGRCVDAGFEASYVLSASSEVALLDVPERGKGNMEKLVMGWHHRRVSAVKGFGDRSGHRKKDEGEMTGGVKAGKSGSKIPHSCTKWGATVSNFGVPCGCS